MDISSCSPENWLENESHYLKQLEDSRVWNDVPLLNVNELHNFKDSNLVRFRGMIQDMHSPEFYLEKFEVVGEDTGLKTLRNGKYCDAAVTNTGEHVNFESSSNITSERQTFVVISVPGINNWVQTIEENAYKQVKILPVNKTSTKRTFDETMDVEVPCSSVSSTESVENQKKTCNETKQVSKNSESQTTVSKEHILNFPLPNQTGKTCHLKIYKNADLKLNEMFEFVGFLSIDPLTEAVYQEDDEFGNTMERETVHPPSSLVPRIHCVTCKRLKHNNPLLENESDNIDISKFDMLRKELIIVLTQLLLGDDLAAEYLIFHLLSEIYMRRDFLPLGKFSLNISNIPQMINLDYATELYKFIEMLVPKSYYLPMTLENMNDLSFIPKKDYECNRLTSGILQLSQNTHVVLDETKLSPGQLNSSGISSVRALKEVIQHQKLTYDFNYYKLDFDCDIPFLILSEGKSLLNSDVHVILQPEQICIDTFSEIVDAAKHFLKTELLNDIRKYLTLVRQIKYEISDELESLVQQEFVDMRQQGNVTTDDLHTLLVLARLVSISKGKTSMDEDCWRKACNLEKLRKSRIGK